MGICNVELLTEPQYKTQYLNYKIYKQQGSYLGFPIFQFDTKQLQV